MSAGYESDWLLDNRALIIGTISEVAREDRISLSTGLEKGLATTSTKGERTPNEMCSSIQIRITEATHHGRVPRSQS